MFVTPMISHKKKANACRRMHDRSKIDVAHVTAWSPCDPVKTVSAIEADTHGARLMLPWNVQKGEKLIVSVANEVGLYQTQVARVAWTQKMEYSGRVIAGVEFHEQLKVAV
jgi:hypothetical protein